MRGERVPMTDRLPKFRREPAERRRQDLVEATLAVVAEAGVRGATVRAIAERAGVTQGLIRHHFRSKEELVAAAYARHMTRMTAAVWDVAATGGETAQARLARFVAAALTPPVMAPRGVALWAGFLTEALHDPVLLGIHEKTYLAFRDLLETLIADALREAGKPTGAAQRRRLAIACNALIDGLWLEGAALPGHFGPDEIGRNGLDSVSALIGVKLSAPAPVEETTP
jgi:AcrR family transcriptional regulator